MKRINATMPVTNIHPPNSIALIEDNTSNPITRPIRSNIPAIIFMPSGGFLVCVG